MCEHQPRCPDALAPDQTAARVTVSHPEQGWSLLCNGVVLFDDAGILLPGGREPGAPRRTARTRGDCLASGIRVTSRPRGRRNARLPWTSRAPRPESYQEAAGP